MFLDQIFSLPLSSSRICGPLGAPPYIQDVRTLQVLPNCWATPWTCWANSRVGQRTRTMGPSPCCNKGWLFICITPGTMNYRDIE